MHHINNSRKCFSILKKPGRSSIAHVLAFLKIETGYIRGQTYIRV